ncbi:MAG: CAP domain-containing protein, partial [Dehalococcoidia bacterium]
LAVASLCLFAVALQGRPASALTSCEVADYSIDGEEARLLTLINEYRLANGRGTLALHDDLNRTATWMAADLAINPDFGHTDTLGRGAFQRAVECGYSVGASENLTAGRGTDTADEAFAAWRASTGHNNNMLSSHWADIGIARVYVEGSMWRWYWATEFGAGEPPTPTPTSTMTPTSTPTPTVEDTATPTPTPKTKGKGRKPWSRGWWER